MAAPSLKRKIKEEEEEEDLAPSSSQDTLVDFSESQATVKDELSPFKRVRAYTHTEMTPPPINPHRAASPELVCSKDEKDAAQSLSAVEATLTPPPTPPPIAVAVAVDQGEDENEQKEEDSGSEGEYSDSEAVEEEEVDPEGPPCLCGTPTHVFQAMTGRWYARCVDPHGCGLFMHAGPDHPNPPPARPCQCVPTKAANLWQGGNGGYRHGEWFWRCNVCRMFDWEDEMPHHGIF